MLKWLKINPKFFLYTFLALVCLFTVSALAQANIIKQKQDAISQGGNQEAWLSEAFTSNAVAGLQSLVGVIPDNVLNGTATSWIPGGAIGSVNQVVAYTFTPAASGVEYIAQTWNGFLGKPAYAQTNTGFQGLQPILPIWRGFRNVIYILASLVFIIIGIMIMLRVKISPQAVITVQNAIPQLITTLILVTFSYAIAGLLIDLMSLVQGIALSTLFAAKGIGVDQNILSQIPSQAFFSKLPPFLGIHYNTYNLQDLMSHNGFPQTFDLVNRLIPILPITLIGGLLGAATIGIASIPSGPVAIPIGIFGGLGVSAILLLVILIFVFIKLIGFLFALIKVYVNVILQIILAPLSIGLGAFPGSKQGFSSWLIGLIANLAVFPGCLLFLVFINVIMETISGGSIWTPSIMDVTGTGVFYLGGKLIAAIFGFGAFMILSKLPELIPQAIFALKPSPWQQAYDQGTKEITGGPAQVIGVLHTVSGVRTDWKNVFGKKETGPLKVEVTNQPGRATNQPHPQTQSGVPGAGGTGTPVV